MKPLTIHPPLLNSANPWCTTLEQLRELYSSPHTGAVTTRTSLLNGFPHDESIHQFTFYNPSTLNANQANPPSNQPDQTGSLNTLGYSPKPLSEYLEFTKKISDGLTNGDISREGGLKPFIISVTGSVEEIVECYKLISSHQRTVRMVLAMEVNLSCPNIPGNPPPAYDSSALLSYLRALKSQISKQLEQHGNTHVPVGIKTPPYTYHGQYQGLIDALLASAKEEEPRNSGCPVSFITATNTLGSSLLLTPQLVSATSPPTSPGGASKSREVFHHTLNSATGTGIGGLAGAPLHPLALGNGKHLPGMNTKTCPANRTPSISVHHQGNVVSAQGTRAYSDNRCRRRGRCRWVSEDEGCRRGGCGCGHGAR